MHRLPFPPVTHVFANAVCQQALTEAVAIHVAASQRDIGNFPLCDALGLQVAEKPLELLLSELVLFMMAHVLTHEKLLLETSVIQRCSRCACSWRVRLPAEVCGLAVRAIPGEGTEGVLWH